MQNATLAARPHAAAVAASLVPQLAARERDHDRAGTLAIDNLRLLAEEGLLTINLPVEYGGFGEMLGGTIVGPIGPMGLIGHMGPMA